VFGPLPASRSHRTAAAAVNRTRTTLRGTSGGAGQTPGFEFRSEHVAVGCGSVSLCQQLVQITASAGDEVIFGWRSFELYPPLVQVAGATAIQVPLTDHTFDLDAMLPQSRRTRLIFVCNPNNPTSTVVARMPDRFIAGSADILIAIDEAYAEYIREPCCPTAWSWSAPQNVVVLRTFSKPMAGGLRIGYAVGHPS